MPYLRSNRGAVLGILGGGGGKMATLSATLILAAIYTPINFAHFAALHVTASTIGSLLASGTSIAINHQAAAGAAKANVISFSISGAVIVLLGSAFAFSPMFLLLTGEHTLSIGLAFLVPPAIVLGDNALASLAGRGMFKQAAVVESVRGLSTGALMLTLGLTLGPVHAILGIALVDTAVGLGVLGLYKPLRTTIQTSGRRNARIAVQGITGSTAALIANWVFQTGLTRLYGLEVFAAYNLCVRITNLILLPPNFAARNLLSQLLNTVSEPPAFRRTLRSYASLIGAVTIASICTIALLSATVLSPVVTRYAMAGILFVMLLVTLLRVCNNFLGILAVSLQKRGAWVGSDIVAAIVLFSGVTMATVANVSAPVFTLTALGASTAASLAIRGVATYKASRVHGHSRVDLRVDGGEKH